MIPLVAIVGPTATGKTALAVTLAESFQGEVVNADSRQVYRHMDIGTGKPSPEERRAAPHHVLDVVDPDDDFHVALWLDLAASAIRDIHSRGRLPFLVGGTGHYVWALLEGLRIPPVPPNPALRSELEAVAASESGRERLAAELQRLDPAGASRIDPRNVRRLVRAIEVSRATGKPFSEVGSREPPPYQALILGLTAVREALYARVDDRIDAMVAAGWLDEVRRLLAMGYSPSLPSFSSLGYREMAAVVEGELPLAKAVKRIKTATHAFARRQYSWFKPRDSRITWLDITTDPEQAAQAMLRRWTTA